MTRLDRGDIVPLSGFEMDELTVDTEGDGATIRPREDAIRERVADDAGDRFDEDDVSIIRTEDGIEGRVTPGTVQNTLRTELAEREDVDEDDITVEQDGDRFVARVDESPDEIVDVNVESQRLLAPESDQPVIEADIDTQAARDRAGPLGGLVAAGGVGVAAPEPTSSVGGAAVAGAALAIGAGYEATRRRRAGSDATQSLEVEGATASASGTTTEVGISDQAVSETTVDIGEDRVSSTEVGIGSGTGATEVGLGEGTTSTEVGTGRGVVESELDVGSGSGSSSTAERVEDDSVVPDEFPLPGRDFAADPRRDRAQSTVDPEDVLEATTATAIGQQRERGTGDAVEQVRERRRRRQQERELQEILEGPGQVTIGEVDDGFTRRRAFPTGAGSVVGMDATEPEISQQEVTEPSVTATATQVTSGPADVQSPLVGVDPRDRTRPTQITGTLAAADTAQMQETRAVAIETTIPATQQTAITQQGLTEELVTTNPTSFEYGFESGYGLESGYGYGTPGLTNPPTPPTRPPGRPPGPPRIPLPPLGGSGAGQRGQALFGSTGTFDSGIGDLDMFREDDDSDDEDRFLGF